MGNQEIQDSTFAPSVSKGIVQTATLGMGCFWSPEARFGHLPGVIRTRVGYAGGTSVDPTYRQMGTISKRSKSILTLAGLALTKS